jgi:hypothetical protein
MWAQRCHRRYGDFDVVLEDVACDEVVGGPIVRRSDAGHASRVARQQERDVDPGLPKCGFGRALARPGLDQRDRSALQRRMMLAWLMRCRF